MSDQRLSYLSIAEPVETEIDKVKGSRFLARAEIAVSGDDALAAVDRSRARMPDATHHCSAWRISPDEERANDDGEPSGSAGRPILARIDGLDLERVVVIVTRYYGGTKLGTGGLVRAYGEAAAAVLAQAAIVETIFTRRLTFDHAYELSAPVNATLAAFGLTPVSSAYDTAVHLVVDVPVNDVAAFTRELSEATGGQLRPDVT